MVNKIIYPHIYISEETEYSLVTKDWTLFFTLYFPLSNYMMNSYQLEQIQKGSFDISYDSLVPLFL